MTGWTFADERRAVGGGVAWATVEYSFGGHVDLPCVSD